MVVSQPLTENKTGQFPFTSQIKELILILVLQTIQYDTNRG